MKLLDVLPSLKIILYARPSVFKVNGSWICLVSAYLHSDRMMRGKRIKRQVWTE